MTHPSVEVFLVNLVQNMYEMNSKSCINYENLIGIESLWRNILVVKCFVKTFEVSPCKACLWKVKDYMEDIRSKTVERKLLD